MKVGILSIGTELLMGQTVNTNAAYLGKVVNDHGHSVLYQLTVGDNPQRIESVFLYLKEHCDLVITTGGLGPTQDDLTKETIAKTMGLPLVEDEAIVIDIEDKFKKFKRTMSENNRKQALKPLGSTVLFNRKGTAPGLLIEEQAVKVILLPGPPREMSAVVEDHINSWLASCSDSKIYSTYVNLFGIGESSAAELIDDLVTEQTNPTIALYAKIGQVSIRITGSDPIESEAIKKTDEMISKISSRLKAYIIGFDDEDVITQVVDNLLNKQLTISFAESCTGGLLVKSLTDYGGVSSIINESYITYSNEAKERLLGVDEKILKLKGAVSDETARGMAEGLRVKTGADICVSVTGIAGPSGGSDSKPVGTVYSAICFRGETHSYKYHFGGDRERVRIQTTLNVYNEIRKLINNS